MIHLIRNASRAALLATAAASLAACVTSGQKVAEKPNDNQREILMMVGLHDFFRHPVERGQLTVVPSSGHLNEISFSFDPRFVSPDEIDAAGKNVCEGRGGRKSQLLTMDIGQPDESHYRARERAQTVSRAVFFCTNGSAADEAGLAEYQGFQQASRREQAMRDTMRQAAEHQVMLEAMKANRDGWKAMLRRDEQRATGATGYKYVPVK